ncbi:hypothetical protein A2311_05640 [candidate division WOR-1 bacterium RIFOXYB2_FULL_48_7]|uniref:Uncharacterized protein n=1 Tax=candidate division WOR-1 bacterium RIFOXYB2_FULL_48_7 TaxID=1802583 RepID=A0A1F4TN29_UNCSA|nr:MAG: hypothetical protein A2311_05640 [candidate division WOR-1 bacterium RIFOXYB2_FULL_48_7]
MVRVGPGNGRYIGQRRWGAGADVHILGLTYALRSADLKSATRYLDLIIREGSVQPRALCELMNDVVDLAWRGPDESVAQRYMIQIVELDLRDDLYLVSANNLGHLSINQKLEPAIAQRFCRYFDRAEFHPERPRELLATERVCIAAGHIFPTIPIKAIDTLWQVFNCLPDDQEKIRTAQSMLFRLREYERATGRIYDRSRIVAYANHLLANLNDQFLDDPEIIGTIVVDLVHFDLLDHAERVAGAAPAAEDLARKFVVMARQLADLKRLVEDGAIAAVASAGDDFIQQLVPVMVEASRRPASATDPLRTEFDILYVKCQILYLCLVPEGLVELDYQPTTPLEKLLACTGEASPALATLMEKKIRLAIESINRFLGIGNRLTTTFNALMASYMPQVALEHGHAALFSACQAAQAYLRIDANAGDHETVILVKLRIDNKHFLGPKFQPADPLLQRFLIARALLSITEGVLVDFPAEREKSVKARVEMDREVKLVLDGLAATEARAAEQKILTDWLQAIVEAEAGLTAQADEMLTRYAEAREITDRLMAWGALPTINYPLNPVDQLAGLIARVTIIPGREPQTFTLQVTPAGAPEGAKPISLLVDGKREKVTSPELGYLADFILSLIYEVLAKYLASRLPKGGFPGYVVTLSGQNEATLQAAPDAPVPQFRQILDRAFEQILRDKGVLSQTLYSQNGGMYSPIAEPTAGLLKRRLAQLGNGNVFVAKQVNGRIVRLPVRKRVDAHGQPYLGSYQPSAQALAQQQALDDKRPLPQRFGMYLLTRFPDDRIHLLPLFFRESEDDFLQPDQTGRDLIDQYAERVAAGEFRDDSILLRHVPRAKRAELQPLIAAGGFTQSVEVYPVYSTYQKPDFVSVAELLAQGYPLEV